MSSEKLKIFHDTLDEMLNTHYLTSNGNHDYRIKNYCNVGSISWLDVIDKDTNLKIAEVISVERFGTGDTTGESLLVIDYVNSDSRRYEDIEQALSFMESILIVASDRKKANEIKINIDSAGIANAVREQQENQVHLESLRADEIKLGTIDPNKLYLVGSRHCCKTAFYQYLLKSLFCLSIKDVIFNDPATVVFWGDGSKTIVQCQNGEPFDPEKGLAMAISKKVYGNKYDYYEIFKKWVGKYNKKKSKAAKNDPVEFISNGHQYVRDDIIQDTEVIRPYCDTSKENDNE